MKELGNWQLLENDIRNDVFDIILRKEVRQIFDWYSNRDYYHLMTPALANKIAEIFDADDEYNESIGRYAFISNYGKPVTLEFLFKLKYDPRSNNSSTQHLVGYDLKVLTVEEIEALIAEDVYQCDFNNTSYIEEYKISDIVKYRFMKELEKDLTIV